MISGLTIKQYLEERGIKQAYISEKTGISKVALNQILNDNRRMEVNEYATICMALNLPLDYFRAS